MKNCGLQLNFAADLRIRIVAGVEGRGVRRTENHGALASGLPGMV